MLPSVALRCPECERQFLAPMSQRVHHEDKPASEDDRGGDRLKRKKNSASLDRRGLEETNFVARCQRTSIGGRNGAGDRDLQRILMLARPFESHLERKPAHQTPRCARSHADPAASLPCDLSLCPSRKEGTKPPPLAQTRIHVSFQPVSKQVRK